MNDLDKILKIIENAPDEFESKIPDIEKKIFRDVSLLLKDLKTSPSGKIETSIDNLKLINEIKSKLGKIVVSKEYSNLVNKFVSSIPDISNFQTSTAGLTNESKKMMTAVAKAQIDSTLESLIGSGYKQEVVSKLYNTLLTNVTSGGSYADLTEQLRNQLITTEEKPGVLSKYAKTFVTDSLGQFAGQGNKMIADTLGSEWFQYVGSNLTTTREFCEHLRKKRYVHISEFPTLLKGEIDGHKCKIYEATGLPYGMKEDTNVDNFIENRGGWNCGHELIPVSEATVPQAVREKIEYSQKEGIIGGKESKKLVAKGLLFDPFQINSLARLIDAFNEKVTPKIRKLAFENMLKYEKYEKEGDVYLMNGAEYNITELQSATKFTKAGYLVVFPSKGQIKQIKKSEGDENKRKNDIYTFNKKDFTKKKAEIKTMGDPSIKTIIEQISSGSGQAPHLVLDITGSVNKTQLLKGIRAGWSKNKNIRVMHLNYKGQWYELDKKKVESKWPEENIR